ncbi:response regulator [Spartinivicinus poritis]|uniref:Response regulator n=1 Tax=Spartinivicinus poritis TaxID=2994640 RepID=A0ABT5UBZ3_9GAMM|nr:response regulator [Spartinivicinus sp. A2-2]MDE1463893.1 response regulator [Spartinivicinus sp. A2-2]
MNKSLADLTIMVLEDHEFQRNYLRLLLQQLGISNLLEAEDGQTALTLVSNHSVDVVICDLNLPGMHGAEFLHHLGKRGFSGGVIIASEEQQAVLENSCQIANMVGLQVIGTMAKPLRADWLESTLTHFCTERS